MIDILLTVSTLNALETSGDLVLGDDEGRLENGFVVLGSGSTLVVTHCVSIVAI